jgi:DNA-binding MarR family transcriptional regulator
LGYTLGSVTSVRRTDPPGSDPLCRPADSVDALVSSWRERRPDLDFAPVAVIARLGRVRSHIDAALDDVFRAYDLGAANFSVLVTLARIGDDGRVSQRRLMDELGLSSGTVSVRIDRLVKEGLVDRGLDPESRRNTLITLTPRGRALFERVVPAHLANERRLLSALTDDEQEVLASLLRKLLIDFEGSRPPAGARFRLGLTLAPAHVAMAMRESVGLPPVAGLLVRAVEGDGPGDRAGIRTGDVLLRGGSHELCSIAGLYAAIDDAAGSRRLDLTLLRGTEEQIVTVELADAWTSAAGEGAAGERAARGEHRL